MRQLEPYCLNHDPPVPFMTPTRLELVMGGAGQGGEPVSPQRIRIVDGALRCLARQGISKTTLDDVAREASCSRATVYRVFPGGKDGVLAAVADTEVARLFSAVAVKMGEADDLEDVLVAGMTEAATRISGHEALTYLLEFEPGVILPRLAFGHMDDLLASSSRFIAPFLARWLDPAQATRIAEWASRLVLSYLACPADDVDLTSSDQVRSLVRVFILPAIGAIQAEGSSGAVVLDTTTTRHQHQPTATRGITS